MSKTYYRMCAILVLAFAFAVPTLASACSPTVSYDCFAADAYNPTDVVQVQLLDDSPAMHLTAHIRRTADSEKITDNVSFDTTAETVGGGNSSVSGQLLVYEVGWRATNDGLASHSRALLHSERQMKVSTC